MVPMAEKFVWIFITMFPVFVSITQFFYFWVMSYENWKHILGVFKMCFQFLKLSFQWYFCNTPTCMDPLSVQHTSAAFDASSTAFFSTNIFIFLSSFFGLRCTILSFFFFFHFIWSTLHCSFFLLFHFFSSSSSSQNP